MLQQSLPPLDKLPISIPGGTADIRDMDIAACPQLRAICFCCMRELEGRRDHVDVERLNQTGSDAAPWNNTPETRSAVVAAWIMAEDDATLPPVLLPALSSKIIPEYFHPFAL